MPSIEANKKMNKISRERLQSFREEAAQLLFNTDDYMVTIKDYLCVIVVDMQLLKFDLTDLQTRLDSLEKRFIITYD